MSLDDELVSTLAWWRDAGVDTLADDAPRYWFAAAKPRARADADAPPPSPRPAAPADMPGDLAQFRAWLLSSDVMASPPAQRLDASGDAAAGLMILIDQPEPGDARAGMLLSGEAGALFDKMLAAMGRGRRSIYLASLSPARFPGGRIADEETRLLADLARHHIALVAPRALLLMGDAPSRALCATTLSAARGEIRNINHDGGTVSAVATFHPRFLLQQSAAKAECWKDLRMLMGVIDA